MTGEQKRCVQEMRINGDSYSQIAERLGLSINTVKSYCRRYLSAPSSTPTEHREGFCKQCEKKLEINTTSRTKVFCSDHCRYAWWNSHRDESPRKAIRHFECACCGRLFTSYGSRERKYCSHSCFIKDRFGEEQRT